MDGLVLAIGAHPDDVEFTSGGTLARWIAEGWRACLVVCTDGSKGSHDPAVDPAALAARRQEEQRTAATAKEAVLRRALGVAEVEFLGHPDGELSRAPDLVAELVRLIRRCQPQRLLTWDPWRRYELHPDHRVAGLAALDAVLAAGNPHYYPDILAAHQVQEVYLFGAEEPDVWVDITATIEQKLDAVASHGSQVEKTLHLAEDVRRCNLDYGRQCGSTYAEAFKVLQPFCQT
jgi:LmbE family N-acetylglucosaminyl deacetylase